MPLNKCKIKTYPYFFLEVGARETDLLTAEDAYI